MALVTDDCVPRERMTEASAHQLKDRDMQRTLTPEEIEKQQAYHNRLMAMMMTNSNSPYAYEATLKPQYPISDMDALFGKGF